MASGSKERSLAWVPTVVGSRAGTRILLTDRVSVVGN